MFLLELRKLRIEVGMEAIKRLEALLRAAAADKPMNRAIADMSRAYCIFAQENPGLYQTLIALKMDGSEQLRAELPRIITPFIEVISQSHLPDETVTHLHRMLRCLLHGYLTTFPQRLSISWTNLVQKKALRSF